MPRRHQLRQRVLDAIHVVEQVQGEHGDDQEVQHGEDEGEQAREGPRRGVGHRRHQPGQPLVQGGDHALPDLLRLLRIAQVQALVQGLEAAAQGAQPVRQALHRVARLAVDGGDDEHHHADEDEHHEERDEDDGRGAGMQAAPAARHHPLHRRHQRIQEVGQGEGDHERREDFAHVPERPQHQDDGGDGRGQADPRIAEELSHAGAAPVRPVEAR